MLWVVLPLTAIDLVRLIEVGFVKVRLIEVLVNVLVVIVYVLVVDVHVDVAVAPSATPTPAPAPGCSQGNAGPEGNRRSRRIIAGRRVVNWRIRVSRRTIDYRGVVGRNVNHVGIGLLNHDDLFTPLDRLGFHFLLCAGF